MLCMIQGKRIIVYLYFKPCRIICIVLCLNLYILINQRNVGNGNYTHTGIAVDSPIGMQLVKLNLITFDRGFLLQLAIGCIQNVLFNIQKASR